MNDRGIKSPVYGGIATELTIIAYI